MKCEGKSIKINVDKWNFIYITMSPLLINIVSPVNFTEFFCQRSARASLQYNGCKYRKSLRTVTVPIFMSGIKSLPIYSHAT